MKTIRIVLAIAILVILFIFSMYNPEPVQLTLFKYQTWHLPLALVLIFVFFLGFFLAALYFSIKISLLRRQLHLSQREKEALQKDLASRRSSTTP